MKKMNKITDDRLREIIADDYAPDGPFYQIRTMASELLAARKQIESLKIELDLAHKMHDVAVKELDYERGMVKVLIEKLWSGSGGWYWSVNRKS
jgi:hypothetical protein